MSQNHYCCRCHRTTPFLIQDSTHTCTQCGVIIDTKALPKKERGLVGDPFRSFRTKVA